jgi:hypothetical protein
MCQEREDLFNKLSSLRSNLQLNSYVQSFIDSVINSKGSSFPNKRKASGLYAYRTREGCFCEVQMYRKSIKN